MRAARTLVLETSCVARDVREQMPACFRPGYSVVGASVVPRRRVGARGET